MARSVERAISFHLGNCAMRDGPRRSARMRRGLANSRIPRRRRRPQLNPPRLRQDRNLMQLLVLALLGFLSFAIFQPANGEETTARHGMVVAQEARAARIGIE